ncbi:MAG: helix-turn-helix domain-containing protein [Acetobacterium sp.]|nr:helix-turn-helix domain-containing protein [Bacillota bacterium]MCG2730788.1 helix-turn-helix domain-containing protein [Acetobacterium sp.]
MKLSIDIIFEQLICPEARLISGRTIQLNLTGVRFCRTDNGHDLNEELLYLSDAKRLAQLQSPTPLSFICQGPVDETLLDPHWSVIITPTQTDVGELFEAVQAIFDRYHQWLERLNAAIFNGHTLQTIFDEACFYLKNPAALFDDSQGLLMRTSNMDLDKLDAIWAHVLEKGFSLKEVDSINLSEKFKTQRQPFYYQSPDTFGNIKRLIAPIHVNGQLFGSLAMTELISPLTRSEYANLCLAQQIIENALKVNDEFCKNLETPWYLYRLIKEQYVDPSILSHHLGLKGRKIDEPYSLWCFSPSGKILDSNLSTQGYFNQLSKLFKDGMIFSYESLVLVYDYNIDPENKKQFQDQIQDFLAKSEFKATKSMVFSDIYQLNLSYLQCQIANEYANDTTFEIINFNDIYADYILTVLDRNTKLDVLIVPQLKSLNQQDPYTHELLLCLRAYITNGKNITAAADSLNIHRHTVVYRLKNIQKLTGLNYETLRDDTMFQLFLSCGILLRAVPQ